MIPLLFFVTTIILQILSTTQAWCASPNNVVDTMSTRKSFKTTTTLMKSTRHMETRDYCNDNDDTGESNNNEKQTKSNASRRDIIMSALLTTMIALPSHAMYRDERSGIWFPDMGEIEKATATATATNDWNAVEFQRLDSSSDFNFYSEPRFVEHVDAKAVESMTRYISQYALDTTTTNDSDNNKDGTNVLDLCSSWTSHIDTSLMNSNEMMTTKLNVYGLGMNAKELESNSILQNRWVVYDLNRPAKEAIELPYMDKQFDVVLCQLSIDYLTRPLDVLNQVYRVLKPGGKIHILFSNRLFLQKAVALWTGADDVDHVYTVASYLKSCQFVDIQAQDLSTRSKGRIVGDPLYVVRGTK